MLPSEFVSEIQFQRLPLHDINIRHVGIVAIQCDSGGKFPFTVFLKTIFALGIYIKRQHCKKENKKIIFHNNKLILIIYQRDNTVNTDE